MQGVRARARVSDFFFANNPNLDFFLYGGGEGGGLARVCPFFYAATR